jgi:hypothetical protein
VATALDLMHYNGSNRLVQFPTSAPIFLIFYVLDTDLVGSPNPESRQAKKEKRKKIGLFR